MPAANVAAVDFGDEGGRGDVLQQGRKVGIVDRCGDFVLGDGVVRENGIEGAEEPVRVRAIKDDDFGGGGGR